MQSDRTAFFPPLAVRDGVLTTDGYGSRIFVRRRRLMIQDGIGRERREIALSRATSGLKRLIVLGHEGYVTFEALRWITDLRAGAYQIDRDGRLIWSSAVLGLDDPRLRRAQALAPSNGTGLEVARYLMSEKLQGQAAVLGRVPDSGQAQTAVKAALADVQRARSIDRIRLAEANGALAYWSAWANLPVTFGKAHANRVPDHWLTFGRRSSPLTSQPRLAANPANALLNYLYALLEAECRLACLAVGLDPGLGIVHADQKSRDSLALDLMEAVRPEVDAFVLDLLATRTFGARDFHETREGVCRILPPLTHHLAANAPRWVKAVAPVAERIAKILADGSGKRFSVPTLLTQDHRSKGREGLRRSPRTAGTVTARPLPPACRSCGLILETPGRTYCDECLPDQRREQHATFSAAGPAAVARLRAQGADPSQRPEAKRKMGSANRRNMLQVRAWDREHERPDVGIFVHEILPHLQDISLRKLAAATGLSVQHCGLIRRGLRVPHPRHWDALRKLAPSNPPA
jgi:CRISPR-associated endonuclease Cas1